MADSIHLEREYSTNGVVFKPGQLSTDEIRDRLRGPKGGVMTEEAAQEVQKDIIRRQEKYAQYSKGIHERHEHLQDAGSIAMGGGAE